MEVINMTMIPELGTRETIKRGIVEKHIVGEAKKLEDIPTEDLRQVVLGYVSEHGRDPFPSYDQLMFIGSGSDQIKYIAGAVEVLRQRHGEDYILDIFGYRKPKNIRENINHLFSGKYPAK